MSLLIKALEQAAKDRSAGRVEPGPQAAEAAAAVEPTLEPPPPPRAPRPRLEDASATPEAAPASKLAEPAPAAARPAAKPLPKMPMPPGATPGSLSLDQPATKAQSPRALAGLANIDAQQQRARAAAVVQAGGSSNAIAFLRGNPVMVIGALAVLFGLGFGTYVYIQIAHPGLLVRHSSSPSQPAPAQPATPAPAASASTSTPQPDYHVSTVQTANVTVAPAESTPTAPAKAAPVDPPAITATNPPPVSASAVIAPAGSAEAPRLRTPERQAVPEQRADRGALRAEAAQPAPAAAPVSAPPAAASSPTAASPAAASDPNANARERIAVSATNAQPRLNPQLSQAYALLQAGKTEEAQALYTKVNQSEPLNIDALLGLAYIATQENRSDEASRLYLRIIELNPRHALSQAALIALIGRADPAASESRLKQLISREPSAFLHFVLGNLYAEQSQWSQAQQAYFQAHHLDPGNADYAYNLAVGLDHLRQTKLALNYYRRAEQLASSQARPNFDVSNARERIRILSSGLE
jgi:tetratricopeptide (TPR) repeat protein